MTCAVVFAITFLIDVASYNANESAKVNDDDIVDELISERKCRKLREMRD